MSDYIRRLIALDNRLNDIKNYDNKSNEDINNILKIYNSIRGE